MYVTGSFCRHNGNFTMHKPDFPYDTEKYIGYSFREMKALYRKKHGLKYKHIEWIIVGMEEK